MLLGMASTEKISVSLDTGSLALDGEPPRSTAYPCQPGSRGRSEGPSLIVESLNVVVLDANVYRRDRHD
jgi:hypothetical protein